MEDFEKVSVLKDTEITQSDSSVVYIHCLGVDDKIHICEPDKDVTCCGVKVKDKKSKLEYFINKYYSCYPCTY